MEDRFYGLDMEELKNSMSQENFVSFCNFIGREKLEISEEDFEVYYPED